MPNAGTLFVLAIVVAISLLALRSVLGKKNACGCGHSCDGCEGCSPKWVEEVERKLDQSEKACCCSK